MKEYSTVTQEDYEQMKTNGITDESLLKPENINFAAAQKLRPAKSFIRQIPKSNFR